MSIYSKLPCGHTAGHAAWRSDECQICAEYIAHADDLGKESRENQIMDNLEENRNE